MVDYTKKAEDEIDNYYNPKIFVCKCRQCRSVRAKKKDKRLFSKYRRRNKDIGFYKA